MDMIIRKYNYRLETGTVGTDNENIATILYNINRMETKAPYAFSNMKDLEEDLGELFFMIVDAKVHMTRFLKASGEKVEGDTAEAIIAAFDSAMAIVRDVQSDETDATEMSAVFVKVYKKLLAIVPFVLALDAQAIGRI